MIKNLLYSLFLHFLLLLMIYANFNLKEVDKNKSSEIAISLVALNGDETSDEINPSANNETKSEKEVEKVEEPAAEAKSEKKSVKNEVKKQPKKLAKSKPADSIVKPVEEEKIKEFKDPEKQEKSPKEVDKAKADEEVNDYQDDVKNDSFKKEKDFGSKKKFDEEQEANDQKNPLQDNSKSMANNLETIDLSAREKFNIQSQLKRCYHRALDETKMDSKTTILVKVKVSEDGYIDSDLDDLVDISRYNDPTETQYKISIDSVRRALDLCSPLRNLPLDKYDVWKEVVLEFGGAE